MRFKQMLLLLLVLAFVSSGCAGKAKEIVVVETRSPRTIQLNDIGERYHKEKNFFGALLVAKDGTIHLNRGFGWAEDNLGYPIYSDTKFKIGSMTKQFTAMAILILEEQGLLKVEDTLDKYIPDYPKGSQIKLYNLLNHSSGIREYTNEVDIYENRDVKYSVEDLINSFKNLPLDFETGDKTSYSNSNYVLLGYIIEQVSGKTYEEFLKQAIFDPLDMKDTAYSHNEKGKDYAVGYRIIGYPDDVLTTAAVDMDIAYAAGALHSTTDDLYKWDQALYTEKLVKKKSLEKMFKPIKENYGFGWLLPEPDLAIHGGSIPGFNSMIVRDMASKTTIIVLCNNEAFQDTGNMIEEIMNIMQTDITK